MTIIRVVDLETTGLEPTSKVVEWATCDVVDVPGTTRWERGRIASSLINPGIHIPPEASAVHHITDDMVADKPTWTDQIKVVTGPPMPDIWCAQNNRFDQQFFNPAGSRWIDTYRCALWLWPDAPAHSNQVIRYWLGLRLADANLAVPHRALGDSYVTAAILRHMLISGATVYELVECSRRPALLPRFTFGKHAMTPIAEVPHGYLDWVLSNITDDEDVQHTAFTELQRRRAPVSTKYESPRDPSIGD